MLGKEVILKAMWDNSTLANPNDKLCIQEPNSVNRIKKLAPIITSGDTIKILFNDNKASLVLRFW